jgi:hypothetical protein
VEGCGLHKKKKWRGLCTSLHFLLPQDRTGGGEEHRMRGATRPWAPAPWCMATLGEEGKTERRPRGSDSGPHLVWRRSTEDCPQR